MNQLAIQRSTDWIGLVFARLTFDQGAGDRAREWSLSTDHGLFTFYGIFSLVAQLDHKFSYPPFSSLLSQTATAPVFHSSAARCHTLDSPARPSPAAQAQQRSMPHYDHCLHRYRLQSPILGRPAAQPSPPTRTCGHPPRFTSFTVFTLFTCSPCSRSPSSRVSHAPAFTPDDDDAEDGRPGVCSPSARLPTLPCTRQQPRHPLLWTYSLRFSHPHE